MAAGASLGVPIGYAADDLLAKRLIDELCECRKYFYGDFYSIDGTVYDRCSRQCSFYYRRDLGQGLLIVYDRPERSGSLPYRIKLKGLKNMQFMRQSRERCMRRHLRLRY